MMNQRDQIIEYTKTLNTINYEIAELARIKEELEARLCALLEHNDDSSKTYVCDKFKVTVKTGYNYTLNKEEYMIVGHRLPLCFNPVKQVTKYELDKAVIRDAEKYGSPDDLKLMAQLISKKPSKLHVSIKAAV
jgi:hypothetical protein